MHTVPYMFSQMTKDLVSASIRLQQATHEAWTFDWERFALVCRHGVAVAHRSALAKPMDELREFVTGLHAAVGVRRSRDTDVLTRVFDRTR